MFNNTLKVCLITLLTFGLAFTAACGDDEPAKNNETKNDTGVANNDAGVTPKPDTDTTKPDTGGETATGKTCADADAPARCKENAATFEFGLASVITKFVVVGGEDEDCCFDLDNDGRLDNMLGGVLGAQKATLDSVNESLATNIADKTLTIVLEHDGLTALTGGDFTVNFFLGQYDGDKLMINPASIDKGTYPLAFLPTAKLTSAGAVTAGPGNVILNLELFGAELELSIRKAQISANVDAANTSATTGVSLLKGKLGGMVIVNEIFDAVNDVAKTCDCLKLAAGTKLINYSTGTAVCADTAANTCEVDTTCKTLATNCVVITAASAVADMNYSGGEQNDALSLAATFEAKAVKIEGVGAAN